jgi:hypothetical protein
MILTQSEMKTWLGDRRQWYFEYYRGVRPIYERAYVPKVGTLFHAGLEAYYREQADPMAVVRARAERMIAEGLDEADVERLLKVAELAGIMLEGYLEWCPEQDAHLRVFSAEEAVEVALEPSPYLLRGKIDARAEDERTGAVVQLEHKTVGSLDDLPKYAQSNFQFLTYDLLAYLLHLQGAEGHERRTDGVLLNMARRVKRTKTATPPFYGRHEVRHNLNELRAHWRHVVAIGDEIAKAREALDSGASHHAVCPPNVGRDSTWGNPYFMLYRVMDDGGDWEGMLRDLYVEHDPLERYDEEEV